MIKPQNVTFVTANGAPSPGIAFVRDAIRRWGQEIKKARGQAGGFIVSTGEEIVDAVIRIQLYTQAELDAWTDWVKIWDNNPPNKAIEVWHPTLVDRNIRNVVPLEVGSPMQESPRGPNVATIKIRKFTPKPVASLGRPTSAAKKPAAEDAQDAELRRLLEEEARKTKKADAG
jgi:hypothetical protein